MNTVKKGDDFEAESLKIISKAIEEEVLLIPQRHVQFYQKKGYYSDKRKKNIYFDITIEVKHPEANRFSFIYIIECKNYKHRVPVDDIEEFYTKIRQVSGVNAKGIFITNNQLQEGALNFAESVGLMVIQAGPNEDYEVVLYKKNKFNRNGKIPFIQDIASATNPPGDLKFIEELLDKRLQDVFNILVDDENTVSKQLDILSKRDIENIANADLDAINPRILEIGLGVSLQKLISYINDDLQIKIEVLPRSSDFLGTSDINKNIISLHPHILDTNRHLFVLAHELGHIKLHKKLKLSQSTYNIFSDPEYNFRTSIYEFNNPKHWIEWQANYYAISLVLSRAPLLARLYFFQNRMGIPQGKVFIDDQYINRRNFAELTKKLSYFFGVSKTSIIHRLNEMSIITNQSRLKSLQQLTEDYKQDLIM